MTFRYFFFNFIKKHLYPEKTLFLRCPIWVYTVSLVPFLETVMERLLSRFMKKSGPVARSDEHPPGIQMVAGSILRSGKTFFRGDWS